MKHIKTLKAAMSVLCVLSILLGAVLTFSLIGAAAGKIPTNVTEVTWSDYLYDGASIALDQPIVFNKASAEYQGGGRFNDTLFNGDITFPSANEASLILFGDNRGVNLVPNGDTMTVEQKGTIKMVDDAGAEIDPFELKAASFGLTSFEDVRFNLKAAMFDNTDGKSATVSVWFNNIHAFTVKITCNRDNINGNLYPVQGNGRTAGNPSIVPHAPTEPDSGDEETAELTKLTWANFGMANYWTGTGTDQSGSYRGDMYSKISDVLFEGYITQTGGSHVNVFGPKSNPNWGGIKFLNPTDTSLSVQGSLAIPNWGFNVSAEAVGMKDGFAGKEYFLQMSVQYVDHDGDGAADDLKLGMWINGVNVLEADAANAKPAEDGYCYFLDHTDYLSTCVMVYHPTEGTTLLRSACEVPENLTEVSWDDYTFKDAPITLDKPTNFDGASMIYQGGSYADKIFNGDITFPSANDSGLILFGDWHGLYMIPNGAELALYRQGSIAYDCGNLTLRAEAFGLTSFEDVRLNLKASLTTNAAGEQVMNIWLNNRLALSTVLLSGSANANFNILSMVGAGTTANLPSFIPHAPSEEGDTPDNPDTPDTNLESLIPEPIETITWSDFGVTPSTAYISSGWLYGSFGAAPQDRKFIGKVKLADGAEVNYGAGDLGHAFIVKQTGSGLMIDCYGGQGTLIGVNGSKKAITAAELGVTGAMADTEFLLGIQMWNVPEDKRSARIAVWFNDTLLGVYDLTLTLETPRVVVGQYAAIHDVGKTSTATSYSGPIETLPTDYTEITYGDFGVQADTYTVTPNTGHGKTFTSTKINSWDKVILTFDAIRFAGDIELSFAGENEWLGFKVMARNDSLLMFQSAHGLTLPRVMLDEAIAGVDLVGGEAYKLQITTALTDATTLKIGLWFNGVLYNNKYIYADLSVLEPGTTSEKVQLATKITMGFVNVGDETGSITIGTPGTTPDPGPGPDNPDPGPGPDAVEIPTPNKTLTWSDFTANGLPLSNGTYQGYTYGWADGYSTLDGVLFEGKIQMTADSQISFGGKDPSHLIYLWLKADGTLNIRNNVGTIAPADGSAMDADFTAADLGISGGIADNPITLKFQVWNVANDKMSARVAIWINDTLLGVYDITVTNAAAQLGNAIGLQFGTYTLESIGGGTTPDPGPGPGPDLPPVDEPYEYEATVEIPTADKTVTWKDFSIRNGTYMPQEGNPYATYGFATGTLNNVLFEGKLKFGDNAAVVYGGKDPSWNFHVEYKGGVLNVRNNVFTLSAPNGAELKTSFTAADLDLDGAIGDEVLTLKLQMWNIAEDNASGRIALWVNDKLLCIYDMVSTKPEEFVLGKGLGVLYGPIVIGDPADTPDSGELPAGPDVYTEITWESFGFADGEYYADNMNGEIQYREWITSGHYSGKINGTKFIGYVQQGIRNQIRYGFSNNSWAGIILDISEEGNLLVQGGLNVPGYGFVVNPSLVGLTTFENTEYKLSISLAFVDADYDGFEDDVMLGIWINDINVAPLCANSGAEENGYVYLYDVASNFGAGLTLYPVYENRPITLRSAEIADPPPPPPVEVIPPPTNLHNITIGDFAGSLHAGEVAGSMSGTLKDLASYDGTLFSMDLNLITSTPGNATYIRFGGKANGWEGFSLQTDFSGCLKLYNYLQGGSTLAFFDPAVAGVNFFEETFNLKMSFEFVDADGNGQKDDIKIGVYFNDALYNAEFLYAYDLAPVMTTYFLAYTDDAVAHPLWVDILKPEVVDLSMFGFSDNYKSQFGLTADQLKVNGVPLGSNYTPFSGDVATFCFWALIPMLALLGVLSVTVLLSKKKQL